jgi:glycerol kinase
VRPRITETTALGVAYLAGLAAGFWGSITDIEHQWQPDRTFSPQMPAEKIPDLVQGWNRAVNAAVTWANNS